MKHQSTGREIGQVQASGKLFHEAAQAFSFTWACSDYLKGSKAIEAVCSTLHQFPTFFFISFQASFFVEQRPLLGPCSVLDCQKTRRQCFSGPKGEREHFVCVERKCNKSLDLLTRWNLPLSQMGRKSNRILSSSTKRVNEPTNIQKSSSQ